MNAQTQLTDGPQPDKAAQVAQGRFLAHIAIAAGQIMRAVETARNARPEALATALDDMSEHAELIRDTAADFADELGCGPEAVEAVRQGLGRLEAFRACQGLGGTA